MVTMIFLDTEESSATCVDLQFECQRYEWSIKLIDTVLDEPQKFQSSTWTDLCCLSLDKPR